MLLEELGVKKIINAHGTATLLGGSILGSEVVDAMMEGSRVFVDMKELNRKAGEYVAHLVGAEAACIVAGATAGLVLSTAACMTRGDVNKMIALPETEGMRDELIVQRLHRNAYLYNLRSTGAKTVEIGSQERTTAEELQSAITEKTAAVMYFVFDPQEGVLPLDKVILIAHERGVPVIVDAAGELPPVENLSRYTRMGADCVVFSGGKGIGGPNNTGIVLGRRDLLDVCSRLGPHNYEVVDSETVAFIGRTMKTSKECVLGLVAALKKYLETDHEAEMRRWHQQVDFMLQELSKTALPHPRKMYPKAGHVVRPLTIPRIEMDFHANGAATAQVVADELKSGDPPIYVYCTENKLYINPQCLAEGEEKVIVSRFARLKAAQ